MDFALIKSGLLSIYLNIIMFCAIVDDAHNVATSSMYRCCIWLDRDERGLCELCFLQF